MEMKERKGEAREEDTARKKTKLKGDGKEREKEQQMYAFSLSFFFLVTYPFLPFAILSFHEQLH